MKKVLSSLLVMTALTFCGCETNRTLPNENGGGINNEFGTNTDIDYNVNTDTTTEELPSIDCEEKATKKSKYTDNNCDIAVIPAQFTVSAKQDEQTIDTGLVIVGAEGSEFVWIPTTQTELKVRDFGSYFGGGGSISGYRDETELAIYQSMVKSCEVYGGFYMSRYEASRGENGVPKSARSGRPWVQFSPQDTTVSCQNLYADNETVQGFFPWGINYDTTLQWLIDTG